MPLWMSLKSVGNLADRGHPTTAAFLKSATVAFSGTVIENEISVDNLKVTFILCLIMYELFGASDGGAKLKRSVREGQSWR